MIKFKTTDLNVGDIGREVTIKDVTGKIANFSYFKNHVEVVFEDGRRIEMKHNDLIAFDDSASITLTSDELKTLINNHPLEKAYEAAYEKWSRMSSYSLSSYRDPEPPPTRAKRLDELEKIYDNIRR